MSFIAKLPDAIYSGNIKNFSLVPNDLLRNPTLSFKAKGIMCLLLSNSNGWVSCMNTLQSMGTDGRDSLYSGLKELEEAGFLWRITYVDKQTKKTAGSFWAYTDTKDQFNIDKQLEWLDENGLEVWSGCFQTERNTGKPYTANPPLRILNNNNTNKTYNNPPSPQTKRTRTRTSQPDYFISCFPTSYQQHPIFPKVWGAFFLDRKEKKVPLTQRAVELIANKFRSTCRDDITWAVKCVQDSIEKGYRGVFVNERNPQPANRKDFPKHEEPKKDKKFYICDPHER